MRLDELQTLFFSLVAEPEKLDATEAGRCFTPSTHLQPEERVKIYADMYLWRLIDVLRGDFPKLVKLLGDGRFFATCSKYLRAYPSEHPDLGKLGRKLAQYLNETGEKVPSELAALEWARNEAFLEADTATCDSSALTRLGPEHLPAARLRFVPAFRLLGFEHDVASLWKALDDEKEPEKPAQSSNWVAVWRKGFEVFHSVVDWDESRAAQQVLAGGALAQVCECFAQREDPTRAAFDAIGSWFKEGWVAEVSGVCEASTEKSP